MKQIFYSLLLASSLMADTRPAQPNVILILVDDLGWQDVKCYDIDEPSPMETPHLDALAEKGVKFWQAYSPAPVCAPSRAAILSGYHPARGEMTSVAGGNPPRAHSDHAPSITPYYTARMPMARYTLSEALKDAGYTTAHSGKWHISKHHYDYPKPADHGFDFSTHDRGVQCTMKPDRITGFATRDPKDPYRLDEDGFPKDTPHEAAKEFIHTQKDKPFFLYYATWLVHTPIVMRSEQLLRKYEKKLGVKVTEEHKEMWTQPGQTNPFYCAMVEQLDYYLGQIFTYLETTEDPRWKGHMLSENTYVFFTSDNGGMEGGHGAVFTDNFPLEKGKISLNEGGTRVPFIVTGPEIPAGVESEVMVNGLDLYPTILSLTGAQAPKEKIFDGKDLSPLLKQNPQDVSLVKNADGSPRDTMMWHFPQSENSSSLRVGDYKLLRRYRGIGYTNYLYRLYNSESGTQERLDIEEKNDLAAQHPELVKKLDAQLNASIAAMGGRLPYGNPTTGHAVPHKEKSPKLTGHKSVNGEVTFTYQSNGAKITQADLLYTPNDGREWLRKDAETITATEVKCSLPEGSTHYFLNLIDENNFMAVYPKFTQVQMDKEKKTPIDYAIKVD